MQPVLHRRHFLAATSSAFAALVASGCTTRGMAPRQAGAGFAGYGALVKDPAGMLDLPPGFSYRVLSQLGDAMSDGGTVPDRADGMGCFDIGNGEIALVRNHELMPQEAAGGEIAHGYDTLDGAVIAGGTTTVVLDAASHAVKRQFRSLGGTMRNCSGGITPWGSWLTCEEALFSSFQRYAKGLGKEHGWVFEVPAASAGLVEAVPLKAMGRFNHEAACVDPVTGMVYMTEDQKDSLLYRFIPAVKGDLAQGGRLQALALTDGTADSRNWDGATMAAGEKRRVRWVDLDKPEAPDNDLRHRGAAAGGLLVARGEGIHMGERELYFCATSGGAAKLGQVFKLVPGRGLSDDSLELFFESTSPDQFNFGDNLCVAPSGHLVVCEDQYTDTVDNHLRGITPEGSPYTIARLALQTEFAGACFSPDAQTLFVNFYAPTHTVAITGPWVV